MNQKQLAVTNKKEVSEVIERRIGELKKSGFLFPKNYNYQNALVSAWMKLVEAKDRNDKAVLETCTKSSIYNALFDMLVQGLNPLKNQCYFIAYGSTLSCQRSYLGTMMLAKRVNPDIADIRAQVVYEGDEFESEFVNGRVVVTQHKQKLGNIDTKKIMGAYCCIVDKNDNVIKTEVMSGEEIKEAWDKSKMHPIMQNGDIKKDSTHYKFMTEMAKKTIINRTCKSIISSSDDAELLESIVRNEIIEMNESVEEEMLNETIEPVDIFDEPEAVEEKKPKTDKRQEQGLLEIKEENAPF